MAGERRERFRGLLGRNGGKSEVVRFLNAHSVACNGALTVVRVDGDRVLVRGAVTFPDGSTRDEQCRIPATLTAARDWLGY
jgi:hypothetical protein